MHKNWIFRKGDSRIQEHLVKELKISALLARLLVNRGIKQPRDALKFLKPGISDLLDPLDLPDMEKAVKRVRKALKDKQPILICGDYDVDGITGCVLLHKVLGRMGGLADIHLPHRIKDGYGISRDAVKIAVKKKALAISVDCGISDFEEVDELRKSGIDTIIIDHHTPHNGRLPAAFAIINPKLETSSYGFKDLAGVGVVLKVAQALTADTLEADLDIVALGTVADVVPLLGENRIIVKEGLARLNATRHNGLKALIDVSGIKGKEISVGYISYILGPRINAGGRMGDAGAPLKLLLSDDYDEAKLLANSLNTHNRNRQNIEEKIMNEAVSRIESGEMDFKNHYVIVLGGDSWHRGVLGIIASKIADRYYRPVIIISFEDGVGKGSCRSIRSFHILEALSRCRKHLQDFGGHKCAAGITVLERDLDNFRESVNAAARDMLKPSDLIPSIEIDAEVRLADLNHGLLDSINELSPFGCDNPEPLFSTRNLSLKGLPQVMGRGTLKMWVTDGNTTYQAVGFAMASLKDYISSLSSFDAAFKVSADTWEGRNDLQLEIEDIRPSEPSLL